jgi:trehalose 6-phosphate phosphatase
MTPGAPRLDAGRSLFLDVDGTLIGFASSPTTVVVPEALKTLLQELQLRLQGALALVSGRRLGDLTELFAPLRLPMAGLHGGERRDALGRHFVCAFEAGRLNDAHAQLDEFAATTRGIEIEDKGAAIAVHYRNAPAAAGSVARAVAALLDDLGDEYHVLEGNMVLEIKPLAFSKARAIEAFMQDAPFAGRAPIFMGDDVTDIDGFRLVEEHGGTSIAVGDRVSAQWRLEDHHAVLNWLCEAVAPQTEGAA